MYKLIVTEKPSVAAVIARAIGVKFRKPGYYEDGEWRISWCLGHLAGPADAKEYNPAFAKWQMIDLPIIPSEWKLTVLPDKAEQVEILRRLMNDEKTEEIINACDAGREGELIFRHLYEIVGCEKPVKRLWLSSMEEAAVREAMKNLKPGSDYDLLAAAAQCRERADWLVGINATRLYSLQYRRTLNIGRVMSPTLAMLVNRQKEIKNFRPEEYFTVNIDGGNCHAVSEHFSERAEAERLAKACQGASAVVVSMTEEEKSEKAPCLYDLTTLQRDANRLLGFTAQQTLDIVQELYMKKLCSYPRTDSRCLTDDMEAVVPDIVRTAAAVLGENMLTEVNAKQVCCSAAVSDHYALVPTESAAGIRKKQLAAGEYKILKLICLRTLIAVADPYVFTDRTVELECAGKRFKATDRWTVRPGWKVYSGKTPEERPVGILLNQSIKVDIVEVKTGVTRPPKQYTEDTLLKAMEEAGDVPKDAERQGIGTPATRAGVIEKLISARFARRTENSKIRCIVPNLEGNSLVSVLPEMLKTPKMTADWEYKLLQVEHGELSPEEFMSQIHSFVERMVSDFYAEGDAEILFPSGREAIGKCPRCGGTVIETDKGFFCQSSGCRFGIWKDNKWLKAKHIEPTKDFVQKLISDGEAAVENIYSDRTDGYYSGTIRMDVTDPAMMKFRVII